MSTHAGDIRYKILRTKKQRNKQKNQQTVNNISTTCLSACVDNNKHELKTEKKQSAEEISNKSGSSREAACPVE